MTTLISEQDLDDTIEAVECLLEHNGNGMIEVKRNRIRMLLAWLKLKKSQLPPIPND
mgnify:CR=1 FL=1